MPLDLQYPTLASKFPLLPARTARTPSMDTHSSTDSNTELAELPISPSGIFWKNDFITAEHEQRLISIFQTELVWPERNGRLSLHYGYTFDYKTFGIDPDIPYKEFPEWLQPLIPMAESRPPDQVCLQYYPPGAGIPPHVDSHRAWDQLYALSLGSPVLMALKKGKKHEKEEQQRVEIDLLPRSMMQLSGEARLHWTHGIAKRKTDTLLDGTVRVRRDRWSITYRWARKGDCECGDVELCDTAQARLGTEKEKRSVLALAAAANKGENENSGADEAQGVSECVR